MAEAPLRTKLLAGLGLVCVSSMVGVLYKVSQAASGGFQYSTTSAIAIAEMIKLCMSSFFHVADTSHHEQDTRRVISAWKSMRAQVSLRAVQHIWFLAALYSANNQLSFFVYTISDPGTVFLFKAASTMIVAVIQCLFVGKTFTLEQWKAMLLQGVGMIIVQYNPCQSQARYEPMAYTLMAISAAVTATCAVRNEYLVKNFKISLNVQNALLYAGGSWMNVLAFHLLYYRQRVPIGFFEGYSNPWALGVIFVNALMGLAISAVYKYADAITKCIAGDVTAVVLCIISSVFFQLEPSVTMWCGVFVVSYAVHQYTLATPARAPVVTTSSVTKRDPPQDPPDKTKADPSKTQDQDASTVMGKTAAGGKT